MNQQDIVDMKTGLRAIERVCTDEELLHSHRLEAQLTKQSVRGLIVSLEQSPKIIEQLRKDMAARNGEHT